MKVENLKKYVSIHHQWIFVMIVLLGALFTIGSIKNYVVMIYNVQERINAIKELPVEDYMAYDVQPSKSIYSIGEVIEFTTSRTITQSYPITWTDQLYCDKGEGYYKLIDTQSGGNEKPEVVERTDYPREWGGAMPENPKGTYISAVCFLKTRITMNVETVKKTIVSRSDLFFIQ